MFEGPGSRHLHCQVAQHHEFQMFFFGFFSWQLPLSQKEVRSPVPLAQGWSRSLPRQGRWSKDCLVLLVCLYVSYINILWAESYPVCVESLGDGCGHLSSFCLNLFDRPALFHLVRGYQWGFLVLFSFFYFFSPTDDMQHLAVSLPLSLYWLRVF